MHMNVCFLLQLRKAKIALLLSSVGFSSHYIYQDSKLLVFLMQWYIEHFFSIPGWSGAEIKCTVYSRVRNKHTGMLIDF